ncbi:MAG: DUF1552 domain-containing protein [Deltaproteobacteria bacterium]|nr:DUF1552 domain-containing protein [Deltaproteobacteria bacterium]
MNGRAKISMPSRRHLLRGAAGSTLALPFLPSLRPAHAAASGPRKRLIVFYFSNGVTQEKFWPTASATGLSLSPVLAPLQTWKEKLTAVRGINMETARATNGNSHNVGMTNVLTARKFQDVQSTEFGAVGWGAGISIDQHIGNTLAAGTPFGSLQLGVQANRQYKGDPYSYLSYSGPRAPTQSEDDPRKVFAKVFASGDSDAMARAKLLARKKSILDLVRDDLARVQSEVGREDKDKLQTHLASVSELEKRLAASGGALGTCVKPAAPPATVQLTGDEQHPVLGNMMSDLAVGALSCDATRVVTLQWSTAQSGLWPKFAGEFPSWHHDLSHRTDDAAVGALVRMQTWYMQQLANLAKKLDAVPDDGGTLLDNTVILTISEVAVGNTHSFKDLPCLLLGGRNLGLKGNRLLTFSNKPHNDLFLSIANAMGTQDKTFGDPMFNTGPLAGLFS